jgi:hypothetical protein
VVKNKSKVIEKWSEVYQTGVITIGNGQKNCQKFIKIAVVETG